MVNRTSTILVILAGLSSISACAKFSNLDKDLSELREDIVEIKGSIAAPGYEDDAVVIIYMQGKIGTVVNGYDILPKPGNFDTLIYKSTTAFFAYSDLNRDLTFQASEPSGWYNDGELVDLANFGDRPLDIEITPAAQARAATPDFLIDRPISNLSIVDNINVGAVATLDDPIFSQEEAESGLWQPYAFLVKGNAGIFFLEDYDPGRIPVLFVHGINGTPRSFTPLIDSLDKSRYHHPCDNS